MGYSQHDPVVLLLVGMLTYALLMACTGVVLFILEWRKHKRDQQNSKDTVAPKE